MFIYYVYINTNTYMHIFKKICHVYIIKYIYIVLEMDIYIAIYLFQCYFILLAFKLMPYMLEYEST